MSDQQNIYENLRDDEERRVEGSEMGDSTADFLASEDGDGEVEVRVVANPGADNFLASVTPRCNTRCYRKQHMFH